MLTDRYGNAVSTYSSEARDAYVEGVDLFLGANYGALDAFDRALEADPDFALAHSARARALQMGSRMPEAAAAIADANAAAERSKVTAREQSHLAIYNALLQGRGAAARELICNHVGDHPRDALAAQPATGVFGLIGFSGCDGREAEQLAFVRELEGHYGDDWWFLGQLAFAEAECGAIARSVQTIDRSLAGNPRNANAAHIKAHIHYEQGEAESGAAYLDAWTEDYDRRGALYCHVNWHRALWALELGDSVRAWSILEDNVLPGRSPSPPVNVLTDSASFLFRAELAGEPRRDDLWKLLAGYATERFPKPGIAFADFHSALVFAMAGRADDLARLMSDCSGSTSDLIRSCGAAFQAFAEGRFQDTVHELGPALGRHETLGGSRAQRDVLEFTYVGALLRVGAVDEATRAMTLRRPRLSCDRPDAFAGRLARHTRH